ncbi:uncharacterized protein N7482_009304 [Penicillium canariense]|uniref:Uncharacterized protein n=1 Tax=Penicillium canariense TaxID=189055 RepID=A0A9W9LEP4_9EURO|nr:uncharacterized protein N7482_009304 [Penicillium canariense]KAJ5152826.1 hypothetical protein N7482_009304 [Penicillium canariense]
MPPVQQVSPGRWLVPGRGIGEQLALASLTTASEIHPELTIDLVNRRIKVGRWGSDGVLGASPLAVVGLPGTAPAGSGAAGAPIPTLRAGAPTASPLLPSLLPGQPRCKWGLGESMDVTAPPSMAGQDY